MAFTKVVGSVEEVIGRIPSGSSVMVGGFGEAGYPHELIAALAQRPISDLWIIANNADFGALAEQGMIRRITCSYPVGPTSGPVRDGIEKGTIELDILPQGTLVERIRCGGAGLGGVLTPTGVGAEFSGQFEEIEFGGRRFVLVPPLRADFALIKATVADHYGNLVHRHASRNFNPVMAMAADCTIALAEKVVPPGAIDPDTIHTVGPFVTHVVEGTPRT